MRSLGAPTDSSFPRCCHCSRQCATFHLFLVCSYWRPKRIATCPTPPGGPPHRRSVHPMHRPAKHLSESRQNGCREGQSPPACHSQNQHLVCPFASPLRPVSYTHLRAHETGRNL